MTPDLKLLSGAWQNGMMRIDNVVVPPDAKEKIAAQKDNKDLQGCDLSIDLTKLIGKEVPITLSLAATDAAHGTLILNVDKKPQNIPFTYADGVITATYTANGAVMTIDLPVTEEGTRYTINGTMNMNYGNGLIVMTTTITANKSKPAIPAPAK